MRAILKISRAKICKWVVACVVSCAVAAAVVALAPAERAPSLTERPAEPLRAVLERLTYDERVVLNEERWGAVGHDTPLMAVQVHRDLPRLRRLLASLARVRHVHTALLVVSHSYYQPDMDRLVRAVTFCRVLQLYYPYSVQANPAAFPGPDPNDCPVAGAGNASEDVPCVERDARRVEHKHHWWWKAHYIFEGLEWSAAHRGMVVFLEEDAVVSADLLHVLRAAQRALALFPTAHVVSLGRAHAAPAPAAHYALLAVDAWRPPYYVGLAFNRSAWQRIAAHAMHFCTLDDCSWSYSLLNLFREWSAGPADMVAAAAPRALSTAAWGRGGRGLRRRLAGARLFPPRMRAVVLWGGRGRVVRGGRGAGGAGGCGDLRDQLFCLQLPDGSERAEPATAA